MASTPRASLANLRFAGLLGFDLEGKRPHGITIVQAGRDNFSVQMTHIRVNSFQRFGPSL